MPAVRQPNVRNASSEDPHHHRLDDRQGKEGCDRGINGIATCRQHFCTGCGGERMIGDHHAPRGGDRLLLTAECRTRATAPVDIRHAGDPFV